MQPISRADASGIGTFRSPATSTAPTHIDSCHGLGLVDQPRDYLACGLGSYIARVLVAVDRITERAFLCGCRVTTAIEMPVEGGHGGQRW